MCSMLFFSTVSIASTSLIPSFNLNDAFRYLSLRINQNKFLEGMQQLAIVFDSDSTKTQIFSLYQFAIAHHVAVFFISKQTRQLKNKIIRQLKENGFTSWTQIIFRNKAKYCSHEITQYEIDSRANIERKGYDITLNISDEKSDLIGGYADVNIKLIPANAIF